MTASRVSRTLQAWARLAESGVKVGSIVGNPALDAVTKRALAVSDQMNDVEADTTQWACDILSALAVGDDDDLAHDEPMTSTRDAPPPAVVSTYSDAAEPALALAAARERWTSVLPKVARAKFESALAAAATPDAEWGLLVASAGADKTKVRAADREAIMEAAVRFRDV
mmetsp:Transcript_5036/g.12791  ORF Transcript_5036/g.12791 Transcript_5036/m.12791 type:complete len:169 (-) Transcript_5036:2959-3465(-)